MYSKPVTFVVISVLVVAFVYSSISAFNVYAVPPDPGYDFGGTCGGTTTNPRTGYTSTTCCWTERVAGKLPPNNKANYCQTCEQTAAGEDCKPKQQQLRPSSGDVSPLEEGVLEEPPTPPSGPAAPLQDGGVLQQTPGQGVAPPLTRDQGVLPQDGALQQEPTDEGTGATPRTVEPPAEDETTQPSTEPVPPCPDGLVFDEETDLCALEEPPVTETPEQQDSSEEGEGSENNGNSDNDNNNNN